MSTKVKPNDSYVSILAQDEVSPSDRSRLEQFKQSFKEKTKTDIQYLIRAPGRVNIIGDHIDYHGFAVLPMAIENDIWLGCSFTRPVDGDSTCEINISNINQDLYPTFSSKHSFLYGSELDKSHEWYHYILCGYHGVLVNKLLNIKPEDVSRHAKNTNTLDGANQLLANLKSSNLVVDSNLPTASGLSSSSALVCAAALSTKLLLHEPGQELNINSKKLADDCSKFEHLVGTHGGGMDQAVIMTAQDGYAKYVQFMPSLECKNVRPPNNIVWLVSHCGSSCVKAATTEFNTRVLETKLAAILIVEAYNNQSIVVDPDITLGKVKDELFGGLSATQILRQLETRVFIDGLKLKMPLCRLAEQFESTEERLVDLLSRTNQLRLRCEHVFEESERVEQFRYVCETSGDIELLGRLMTQSHYSLRDKYDCSHENLDELVRVALEAGALGARVTGAGWGGCVVAMVHQTDADHVLEQLRKVSSFSFRTEPRAGCSIIKF